MTCVNKLIKYQLHIVQVLYFKMIHYSILHMNRKTAQNGADLTADIVSGEIT